MTDILHIDAHIKKTLFNRISNHNLEQDLERFLWIAENGIDANDKNEAKENAVFIQSKINDAIYGFDYLFYIIKTEELIEEYRILSKQLRQNSFVRNVTTKGSKDAEKILRKNQIVFEYMRIARATGISLDAFRDTVGTGVSVNTQPRICVNKECLGTNFEETEDSCVFICKNCGIELSILDDAPSFKDNDRVKMTNRFVYTTEGHFKDALNNFECKQTKEISQQLIIEPILKQMTLHKLKKETVTKEQVYTLLEYLKFNEYYDDIYLIYFKITGKPPFDITHLRQELLEMHEQLDEVFNFFTVNKESSLNIYFQLFKLLQLLDFKCDRSDFFFLKSPVKEKEYYDEWKTYIEELAQRYPNQITSNGKKRWRYIPYF